MSASTQTIATVRFGYGFRPGEPTPRGVDDLLATVSRGAAATSTAAGPTVAERMAMFSRFHEIREASKGKMKNDVRPPELVAVGEAMNRQFQQDMRERIIAPVVSPNGFYERLAWFWSDHFAINARSMLAKALAARFEQDAIRPHIGGAFRDLLASAATHPAMLHFLNQDRSVGPLSRPGMKNRAGLNENLAREIIELHTLGVGAPYTQEDVRQFAELLTGLGIDRKTGAKVFKENFSEPGAEKILGRTYGGPRARESDIRLALDDLAAHPATARHIARKLATHFVSDAPSDALVSHVEAAFVRTDGDLPSVYRALLEHDESWERFGEKVKQPFDFLVSSLRAVGLSGPRLAELRAGESRRLPLIKQARRMNMVPFEAPGPQGWPEAAEEWITPQGLASRIEWASHVGRAVEAEIDPRAFLVAALGELATDETAFASTRAEARWEGIAYVLASPEFNRR